MPSDQARPERDAAAGGAHPSSRRGGRRRFLDSLHGRSTLIDRSWVAAPFVVQAPNPAADNAPRPYDHGFRASPERSAISKVDRRVCREIPQGGEPQLLAFTNQPLTPKFNEGARLLWEPHPPIAVTQAACEQRSPRQASAPWSQWRSPPPRTPHPSSSTATRPPTGLPRSGSPGPRVSSPATSSSRRSPPVPAQPRRSAAPPGWRQVRRDSCVGPNRALLTQAIYVRVASLADPLTTVWSVGSATGVAAGLAAYRGVDIASPVQSSGGAVSRNSLLLRTPSVANGADTLVAGFFGRNEAGGITTPRGTTHRYLASTPLASVLAVDDVRNTAGATGSLVARPANRAGCNIAQVIVLRSASGRPPTTPPTTPDRPESAAASSAPAARDSDPARAAARHDGAVGSRQRAFHRRDANLRRRRVECLHGQRPRRGLRPLPQRQPGRQHDRHEHELHGSHVRDDLHVRRRSIRRGRESLHPLDGQCGHDRVLDDAAAAAPASAAPAASAASRRRRLRPPRVVERR